LAKTEIDKRKIPECNIGLVGHVAHGKTTLTQALSGKLTLSHSEELKRGITIRLGYADATIYRCKSCSKYSPSEKCAYCGGETEIVRTVSFIDAPGHETLMATVLTGASLMDGAILLVSATEKCPQPQTKEHLSVLEVVGIKNVIVVQNKIDLVSRERAMENYKEIKNFLKGTSLENATIIPVSSQQKINIDVVLEAIQNVIPTPHRDESKTPKMLAARSFDINRPGTSLDGVVGGVIGGGIVQGVIRVGDEVEIKPGIRSGNRYQSLTAKVLGLKKAGVDLQEAGPGGLLGLMTDLDPYVTKSDSLVGSIVGKPGDLPPTVEKILMEVSNLERFVDSKEMGSKNLRIGENVLINVGTARSVGEVSSSKKNQVEMKLKLPVVVEKGERVVISRQINGRWRLVGYGTVL
jgi:translation initiation factor 2 subunit 3